MAKTSVEAVMAQTAGRMEDRVEALKRRVHELEGPLDQFEALFGCKPTYENLLKISEVTEQAIGIRDRWERLGACQETWDALDDFAKAVNEMEGKS